MPSIKIEETLLIDSEPVHNFFERSKDYFQMKGPIAFSGKEIGWFPKHKAQEALKFYEQQKELGLTGDSEILEIVKYCRYQKRFWTSVRDQLKAKKTKSNG
ncbi:hypothetical protein UFOVP276_75 [uncultured Caudovirales phage]|uniref:Uncharacterized protein n=1 Tax=uncultured Caudovirales phage TaxID=2100421 RepID=A0A6J5LLM4_9CAUD|nr:hypothetical protein UFOVP127_212 [uncultured Caudovirales phage]CAB4135111.1 hypothetical protein UFOVP276_75 [uncultured Caudovirales phage]